MTDSTQMNKAVVLRFNREALEQGDDGVLAEILDADFVNRTALPGLDTGIEGMRHVIKDVLHKGLTDIRVEVLDQVAEGDTVATRKRITAKHTGDLLGAPATGRAVEIIVFDFVRLRGGRYVEHWGLNTISQLVHGLITQGTAR